MKRDELREKVAREMYAVMNDAKDVEVTEPLSFEVADRILALVDAEPGWVSVKERLPEVDKKFLACDAILGIVWIHMEYGPVDYLGLRLKANPQYTHWRPLPKPPKEEP